MNTRNNEKFLLDANAIITPYNAFYPFDIAPTFWTFLESGFKSGLIILLDKVLIEISKGAEMKQWLSGITEYPVIKSGDPLIYNKFAEILEYLKNSGHYKESALAEWSGTGVADPWLIAAAIIGGYTIVTFERPNFSLGTNKAKYAKIPDICEQFNVPYINLYEMLRKLKFVFR